MPPRDETLAASASVGLASWLRLRWWLAPAQIVAVVLAGPIPYAAPRWSLFTLLGLSLVPGVIGQGWVRGRSSLRVALAILGDMVLLTASLALCGGPSNPFSLLYLVYLTLACVLLGPGAGWAAAGIAAAGYAALFFLPADHSSHMAHGGGGELRRHLWSMYFALVAVAVVVVGFVGRVTRLLRQREAELIEVRERAERHQRVANLLVLSAGTAHEMATPLSTIAITAKELEREAENAGQTHVASDARLIRGEVARCRRLLDDLRGHAGALEGEAPVQLNLVEAVRAAQSALPPSAQSRVVCTERAAGVPLRLPRNAFVQVLGNLFRNALDASLSGEPVIVDAAVEDGMVKVSVSDRGHGMDQATRARALEPFFTTKAPGAGLGLGLFLVDRFAQEVGGSLSLDSLPGQGTHVRLEFPA